MFQKTTFKLPDSTLQPLWKQTRILSKFTAKPRHICGEFPPRFVFDVESDYSTIRRYNRRFHPGASGEGDGKYFDIFDSSNFVERSEIVNVVVVCKVYYILGFTTVTVGVSEPFQTSVSLRHSPTTHHGFLSPYK